MADLTIILFTLGGACRFTIPLDPQVFDSRSFSLTCSCLPDLRDRFRVWFFQYFFCRIDLPLELQDKKIEAVVQWSNQLLMMASALIRRSFFFEELGEPAKDPVLSTNSLRNKAIPICNQKIEIDLIFPSTPVPPYETTSIYGESHLLHRMVLRFELVILFLVKILSSESKRPRRPLILTCKVSRYKLRTFWKFFSLFKV